MIARSGPAALRAAAIGHRNADPVGAGCGGNGNRFVLARTADRISQNIAKGPTAIRQQAGTAILHPMLIAQANVQEARSAYADNLDLATGGR